MNESNPTTMTWYDVYDRPVEYQSPFRVITQTKDDVIYATVRKENTVSRLGRVWKGESGWNLSTTLFNDGLPQLVSSKYQGYLLLLQIYRQNGN